MQNAKFPPEADPPQADKITIINSKLISASLNLEHLT